MNLYVILGSFLLGAGGIVGAYFYGEHVQAQRDEAAQVQAGADAFSKQVTQALAVNDSFSDIGKNLAASTATTQAEVQTRTIYIDRVIHEKPLPAVCVLDPDLVRLRAASREALYRAAGVPVPGAGDGPAAAASASSPEQ